MVYLRSKVYASNWSEVFVNIFSTKGSLPALVAVRLQRLSIILLAYHYDIKFPPMTKHVNADSMSRLLLGSITTVDNDDSASYSISSRLPQFQYIHSIYIWRHEVFHSCPMF